MVTKKWAPLQAKTEGVNLTDLISSDLLNELKKNFKDKNIDVVNISLVVSDQDSSIKEDENSDLISLVNKTVDDTVNDNIIVDMNKAESYENIIKTIDSIREE